MSPDEVSGRSRLDRLDWAVLIAVGLFSSVWSVTAARELGPTFDEPFNIQNGLEFWRTQNPREFLAAGTLALSMQVQTLPLYIIESTTGRRWVVATDMSAMLSVARSVNLLFWWLLLLYVMRLGRALGGAWPGRFSVALVGLEPNFLAHAGLATADISVTALLLVSVYHFRAGREAAWGRRIALPGALFGLSILAKLSALIFGPVAMLLIELERQLKNSAVARAWHGDARERVVNLWRASRAIRWDGVAVIAIGVVVMVVLSGSGGGPSFQNTIARMPADNPLRPLLAWLGGLPLFPNGIYAIWFQFDHNVTGQPTYLVGYEDASSFWFYLPILLSIKLPLATLGLLAIALTVRGPRLKLTVALIAIVLTIGIVMRIQTGIRLVLPLVAFLSIGIAVRMGERLRFFSDESRRPSPPAIAVLAALAWLIAGDLRVWPDAVRYTNEFWGHTDNGYLYVSDSNYDWGQGLPELWEWQASRSAPVTVWYFGTDTRFPSLPRLDARTLDPANPLPSGGYLAVGTTVLYGGYTRAAPARELVLRLRARLPIARTRTFLIFDKVAP
ncbi:MAG: hypothetical protein ACRD2N_02830 [Vicinamibacterales bacterium]